MWCKPPIIVHDRSDTMTTCGVIFTTIKNRETKLSRLPPASARAAQKNDHADERAKESMKNTSSPTEKTISSSTQDLGEHAEGHQRHPAHRATWERGGDQCSRSSERHPRQRKGHMARPPQYPSTQTRRNVLHPLTARGVTAGGAPIQNTCRREEVTVNSRRRL